MNDTLKQIEEYIGKERLNRVLEISDILGANFPNNFSIILNDKITFFSSKDLNCLESKDNNDLLSYVEDDTIFNWNKTSSSETFSIIKDKVHKLSVSFNKVNEGINTSNMVIKAIFDYPVIHSYITNVESKDSFENFDKNLPIDEYYNLFKELLFNDTYRNNISNYLDKDEILNMILKVFERPINDLVFDIKNNNQSARYIEQRIIVNRDHYRKLKDIKNELNKAINEAKKVYNYNIINAEYQRYASLEKLEENEHEYKYSKGFRKEL